MYFGSTLGPYFGVAAADDVGPPFLPVVAGLRIQRMILVKHHVLKFDEKNVGHYSSNYVTANCCILYYYLSHTRERGRRAS